MAHHPRQETIHGYLIHKMHKMIICCYVLPLGWVCVFPCPFPRTTSHQSPLGCGQATCGMHAEHRPLPSASAQIKSCALAGVAESTLHRKRCNFHGQNRSTPLKTKMTTENHGFYMVIFGFPRCSFWGL